MNIYEVCRAFMDTYPSVEQAERFWDRVLCYDKRSLLEVLGYTCQHSEFDLSTDEKNALYGKMLNNDLEQGIAVCDICKLDICEQFQAISKPCCENCGRFTDERQMTYTDDNKFICKLCE